MNTKYDLKWQEDVEYCRRIEKSYATSYYLATLLFPKRMRYPTYAIYAFLRLADEIVDSSTDNDVERMRKELYRFKDCLRIAYDTGYSEEPVFRATVWVLRDREIPYEYCEDFLKAMITDLDKVDYATYEDLKAYMYGSAAIVGILMSYIIGYKDPNALKYASELGNAMQMTNFLRDVREDYKKRGRIYLPLADLMRHGLSYKDIISMCDSGRIDERWVSYMKETITFIRSLYDNAEKLGIPLLDPQGRRPTLAAALLYKEILREIEHMGYNVFAKRAHVPIYKKIYILLSSYILSK